MEYHHALKSTETISKVLQRLSNHLKYSFYKNRQIQVDPNKSLLFVEFEKWSEITVHSDFNPTSKYRSQSRKLQV